MSYFLGVLRSTIQFLIIKINCVYINQYIYKLVSSKKVYLLDTFLGGFFLKPKPNNLLCNFIEITLRHVCSPVNLLHIFRVPFNKNTYEGLLLSLTSVFAEFSTSNSILIIPYATETGLKPTTT